MSYEIKSTFKWNGAAAKEHFDVANHRALTESAILVEGKAVENVHVKSGTLKLSITKIVEKIRAMVGTALSYAPFEEFGTRFRGAHAFLRPAFLSSIKKIKDIFKKHYEAVKYVD